MAVVMIVDDDPGVREVVSMSLDHYQVVLAADGAEALDKLGQVDVDAIVLDVMMPRLDGIETLRRIRADQRLKDIPVVMLTAKVGEDDHLRGYQAGADAYVTKPFEPEQLQETVDSVMARSPDERRSAREAEKERAALLRQLERRFR